MTSVRKIFLASSSELKDDRTAFELFINRKNKDLIAQGQFLELVVWEDFLDAMSQTRLQDEYNKAIRECEVFVMLFCTKVGQYTEEEFEAAFKQFKAENRPPILTYFKDAPMSTEMASERRADLQSLWAFQDKLKRLGHYQTKYSNIHELTSHFDRTLGRLGLARGGSDVSGARDRRQDGAAAARALLVNSLLQEVDAAERAALADEIVAGLVQRGGDDGEALFSAVRLFIERCLLHAAPPNSPGALRAMIDRLEAEPTGAAFGAREIEVDSHFFALAHEREAAWERYFSQVNDATLRDAAGGTPTATLIRIRACGEPGFIAPQFLIAGLLSHFNDDWGPVLNAYQHSIRDPAQRAGWFESLQASQWNCWLVWGPSIPICRCAQWQGRFAYQYGYGDENNSLPLIETEVGDAGTPLVLDAEVALLAGEGRAAKPLRLSGRLRWGPHFLAGGSPAADQLAFARAQDRLCIGHGPAHAHHSDGLVMQLERLEPVREERAEDMRTYFSAYLWMMFLVACAEPADADPGGAGPPLLEGKHYPPWPAHPGGRIRVRNARLWEDLLPVFVHANIADPAALHFQRQMLVDNAVALLRQVWGRRADCFNPDDVARGIRFHLVCCSDFSGCGGAVRHPSREPLADLLRQRLAAETEPDFAAAVIVPDAATERRRPWGLARYFSSCHLPVLVDDYFEYIGQIEHEKLKRQPGGHR